MNYTVKNISKTFNVDFFGDENYSINQVSSIVNATEKSIVFLSNKKFLNLFLKSNLIGQH